MTSSSLKAGFVSVAVLSSIAAAQRAEPIRVDQQTQAAQQPICFGFDGVANTPESSLVINYNSQGAFPLRVLMGELDPNIIIVEGQPGAAYDVRMVGCRRTQAFKTIFASGTLDSTGQSTLVKLSARGETSAFGADCKRV